MPVQCWYGVLRPGIEQLLPRARKPGPPYPAQWRGAEKQLEVCFKRARTHAGDLRERLELNWS